MGIHQAIEPETDRAALRAEGQLLRASILDSFAKLETNCHAYGRSLGLKVSLTAPLSRHLKAIRDVRSHAQRHLKQFERLDELIVLRNDIVHSALETVQVSDGKTETSYWQFRNIGTPMAPPRALTRDDLAAAIKLTKQLANYFNQLRQSAPAPAASAASSD